MSIFNTIVPGNETRTPNLPEGEGSYEVCLETLVYKDGKTNPSKREGVLAEFKVVKSSRPDVEIGAFFSHYMGLDGRLFPGHQELQAKELLTFLVAVMGFNPDSVADVAKFRAAHNPEKLFREPGAVLGRSFAIEKTKKTKGARSKNPGQIVWDSSFYPSGEPAAAAAPAPTPPAGAPADWPRSPDGKLACNMTTRKWHDAATGVEMPGQ